MSEIKPKKDDSRAGDVDSASGSKVGDSPKPHGDKLQPAVDEAAEPVQKKRRFRVERPVDSHYCQHRGCRGDGQYVRLFPVDERSRPGAL
jgi:hypothetical protein